MAEHAERDLDTDAAAQDAARPSFDSGDYDSKPSLPGGTRISLNLDAPLSDSEHDHGASAGTFSDHDHDNDAEGGGDAVLAVRNALRLGPTDDDDYGDMRAASMGSPASSTYTSPQRSVRALTSPPSSNVPLSSPPLESSPVRASPFASTRVLASSPPRPSSPPPKPVSAEPATPAPAAGAASSPSKDAGHGRTPSNVSQLSSVGFQEVGFDEDVWTEAPSFSHSDYSAGSVYTAGSPYSTAGTVSGSSGPKGGRSSLGATSLSGSAAGSPARSERTVLGALGASVRSDSLTRSSSGLGLVNEGEIPLVLGVAVVDFNHLIGPTVEYAYPPSLHDAIQADDDLARLLPFLALPDGAHLSEEDYSYFHCTFNPRVGTPQTDVPANRTLFGISCNRQIASADLLHKSSDVTRSMVQKAVIVLASQPVFGPVRDRLGVVTRAYFAQRDFGSTEIIQDFYQSLEASLEGKAGESAIYMGTSLRELVHKFRHRTLVLLKMLLLQKRVMLFGYPVEMLCTYQYSLVSLIPGLLMALRDCGDPSLDARKVRVRPTSLRTSDRASLLRYMGLPLHLFGTEAMFQPYLPLQQMDMLQCKSWLVGTTNQIVTQQKDCKYDLLVNIEQVTFEFADPKMERAVTLTSADRKWMDDIVKVVEDSWNVPETERPDFIGSDDDLRNRFEEYICAFLSSLKYSEFITKQQNAVKSVYGNAAMGAGGEINPLVAFSEQFAQSFRASTAFEIWDACTDPVIFDLSEPRHPCEGKTSAVADIGIRLTEGLHELRIEESLAPAGAAISSAAAAAGSSIFRAFDGVRSEVNNRLEAQRRAAAEKAAASPPSPGSRSGSPKPVTPATLAAPTGVTRTTSNTSATSATSQGTAAPDVRTTLGNVGSSIGSFFSSRAASWQRPAVPERRMSGLRPMSLTPDTLSPRKTSIAHASGNPAPKE